MQRSPFVACFPVTQRILRLHPMCIHDLIGTAHGRSEMTPLDGSSSTPLHDRIITQVFMNTDTDSKKTILEGEVEAVLQTHGFPYIKRVLHKTFRMVNPLYNTLEI